MNTAAKYRKKPVVIEAIEYQQYLQAPEIVRWIRDNGGQASCGPDWDHQPQEDGPIIIAISTLEGVMKARVFDWIIRGIQGEFYPVKPDIFAATYEPVTE